MKILNILSQLPMKTGSGVYYSNLLRGLYDRGYEIGAVYGIEKPFESPFSDLNIKEYKVHYDTDEIPFYIPGMSDKMPYKSTVFSTMSDEEFQIYMKNLEKILIKARDEFKPDIVITHHMFIISSLARKVFKDKKIICISHGTDLRQVKKNPWIKEKYLNDLDKMDYYLTLSKLDTEMLIEEFKVEKNKTLVTGGAYDETIFFEEKTDVGKFSSNETINLVYAGKISRAKGVYELCKAYKNLSSSYNISLDLIGSAENSEKEELIHLSGGKNFKIYNTKDQKAMAEILRKKDIFILPSYYEGLGLMAVEALASNLRVVVTNVLGLIELLGEEINSSNIIEYVDLPRLFDVDKPYEEDIPGFVKRLEEKIAIQIERKAKNVEVDENIKNLIKKLSWQGLTDRIIKEVIEN
ncbi:glycosyltransferase [Citroniella saccharovorans]|uniref:Glycosyltransferase n=1 Tax=Citroniella saccharovorans TaxID=2053367 RepID=A0AAW9MWR5_9FIRM|nr:glycosyltransferase [Citroniella saccharovorans]MEB3429137.1 glycosyltransferase [Citroniella saccharovorans]